jgi:hypothetical protein
VPRASAASSSVRSAAKPPSCPGGAENYNSGLKINSLQGDLIDDSKFEGSLTAVLRAYPALLCRVTRSMFAIYLHELLNCFHSDTQVFTCQRLAHKILSNRGLTERRAKHIVPSVRWRMVPGLTDAGRADGVSRGELPQKAL